MVQEFLVQHPDQLLGSTRRSSLRALNRLAFRSVILLTLVGGQEPFFEGVVLSQLPVCSGCHSSLYHTCSACLITSIYSAWST